MKTIFEDNRPIKSIFWPDEANITVGVGNVESIVPYYENGQMADVLWLAVYRNGELEQRVNSIFLECVLYETIVKEG